MDKVFQEIKKAFLDNFEECEVINQTRTIQVEFKHENDAKWFEMNIAYPKDLAEDELPIHLVTAISPIGDVPSNQFMIIYLISRLMTKKS